MSLLIGIVIGVVVGVVALCLPANWAVAQVIGGAMW